ncbi:hypothetical protein ACEPPN_000099 [Leptodophora sp. 'Broadleaf-Isolate-01']
MSTDSSNDPYAKAGIWIPVTDPARARKFYIAVFDWKCMEFGSPSLLEDIKETYFFTKSGSLYGCFFLKNETKISPPDEKDKDTVDVHTVFAVKDIEESLELIEKNGGYRKVGKTSIGPNMGYIARFVDSEGNLMGIYAMN